MTNSKFNNLEQDMLEVKQGLRDTEDSISKEINSYIEDATKRTEEEKIFESNFEDKFNKKIKHIEITIDNINMWLIILIIVANIAIGIFLFNLLI